MREVVVDRRVFLRVRVAASPRATRGRLARRAFAIPIPVPCLQRRFRRVSELVNHRRGTEIVPFVKIDRAVALFLAVYRHKGVLLLVGESKKTSPPRSYRQAVQLLIKNDYETIMNRITKENNQL